MQTFKVLTCVDSITEIKWFYDSLFILCVLKKRNIVQVWSLKYPEWQCKINEGSARLLKCDWCPDSRYILTTLDFLIRITLWSIEIQDVSYMKYPKHCSKYYDFSADDGRKWLSYSTLICWDSCPKYTMCFYKITGQLLKTVSKESPEFHLGIKTVGYNHLSQLLVIDHFSSQCDVFNVTNLAAIVDIDSSIDLGTKASAYPKITGLGDSWMVPLLE